MGNTCFYGESSDIYRDAERDRKLALRMEMLEVLKTLGRPATSVELSKMIRMKDGPQAISMQASRDSSYFVIEGGEYIKGSKGCSEKITIDAHPHLRAHWPSKKYVTDSSRSDMSQILRNIDGVLIYEGTAEECMLIIRELERAG